MTDVYMYFHQSWNTIFFCQLFIGGSFKKILQEKYSLTSNINSFFSLQKVSKDVEEHAGQIEKLEIGVAGTKVVLKKVIRDVKQQGKEIEGVKVELGEVNTRVDRVEVDVKDTKEKVEELDKKVQNKIEYLYILTPPFFSLQIINSNLFTFR